jgi:hypothetical protein
MSTAGPSHDEARCITNASSRKNHPSSATKAGWSIPSWCADTDISRSKTYQLLSAGVIQSVKVGRSRIIVTSPADFLGSLAQPDFQPDRSEYPRSALPIGRRPPERHLQYTEDSENGGSLPINHADLGEAAEKG